MSETTIPPAGEQSPGPLQAGNGDNTDAFAQARIVSQGGFDSFAQPTVHKEHTGQGAPTVDLELQNQHWKTTALDNPPGLHRYKPLPDHLRTDKPADDLQIDH